MTTASPLTLNWEMKASHPEELAESDSAIQTESSTSTALTLANESTILPTRVANLITALASSTRLTLSGVAFFIETILETSQFSTRLSLGYTRKLLIAAITSARRVYLLSNAALSGDVLTLLDFKDDTPADKGGDAFLQVLDRYTNLGIYVIHHTFTLAELFTMSSFYIAGSAFSSGLAAARESVGLLDSIFGSNESSRTLASIITLVRREVMLDERSKGKRGVVSTLGGLTKAMTAFAVLQNATWSKTEQRIKMKVIHDCTVRSRAKDEIKSTAGMEGGDEVHETMEGGAIAGPGPSTMASRQAQSTPPSPVHSSFDHSHEPEAQGPHVAKHHQQEMNHLADELEDLMGRDDIARVADELAESSIITHILEQIQTTPNDTAEEEEWIEVDRVLDGEDTSSNGMAPLRPIPLNDPVDHTRLHTVLENMSRRIMKRRVSRSTHDWDMEGAQTPKASPHLSPESGSPPKSSPSKRSSPFKALVQAKSAFARRLRFRSSPFEDKVDDDSPPLDTSERMEHERATETVDQPLASPRSDHDATVQGPETMADLPKDEIPDVLFPHDSLITNLHRFMRYSSAAYGQHFLRILGLGNGEYNFTTTAQHHFNCWAFAHHTNTTIDSLLHSSHTDPNPSSSSDKSLPLVHYVSVDHKLKSIVLTCRGTLGLSDILIDLTCDYQDISLDNGDPEARYYVHKGMYQSAVNLTSRQSSVHQGLVTALTSNPGYGLVVCGHSLGGGVAAAFAILNSTPSSSFKRSNVDHAENISTPFVTSVASGLPPGRPIHAYAYGPPALASPDLARYAEGLITSVVLNKDVVPCLSLGVLRDLKNIALTLHEEDKVAEEIIGRVAGLYKRRFANATGLSGPGPAGEAVLGDWLVSLINTMRADMDNDKLYPPGCVYIMEYHEIHGAKGSALQITKDTRVKNKVFKAILRRCESVELRFREPLFTKSMLRDHLPSGYERATQLLYDGILEDTQQ